MMNILPVANEVKTWKKLFVLFPVRSKFIMLKRICCKKNTEKYAYNFKN